MHITAQRHVSFQITLAAECSRIFSVYISAVEKNSSTGSCDFLNIFFLDGCCIYLWVTPKIDQINMRTWWADGISVTHYINTSTDMDEKNSLFHRYNPCVLSSENSLWRSSGGVG